MTRGNLREFLDQVSLNHPIGYPVRIDFPPARSVDDPAEGDDRSQQPITVEELRHIANYPRGHRKNENLYIYGERSFWGLAWPFIVIVAGLIVAVAVEVYG